MDIFRVPNIAPTTELHTKNDYDYKSLIYLIQYDSLEMISGSVLIGSLRKGIVGRDNPITRCFAIFALSDNVVSDSSS